MNRVVHFEIQAENPERAASFYREVFGWQIDEWLIPKVKIKDENRYWQVTTGSEAEPGINGGLVFRRGPPPAEGQSVNSFICTIEVPDLDEHIDRVIRAGGRVAVPKMPIMGVGWLAYRLDSEKNIFGMMQTDEMAQ